MFRFNIRQRAILDNAVDNRKAIMFEELTANEQVALGDHEQVYMTANRYMFDRAMDNRQKDAAHPIL